MTERDPMTEANNMRKEAQSDEDGSLLSGPLENAADQVLAPFDPAGDQPDEDEAARQRVLNDAEQRS